MDYTFLYVLIAIGLTVGLTYLISYLRRENVVDVNDLRLSMEMLNIGMKIVSELRLDKEEEIFRISSIVLQSLEYSISLFDSEEIIIENAIEYAHELCEIMSIELTESRKEIIRDLITLTFNNQYKDMIEE